MPKKQHPEKPRVLVAGIDPCDIPEIHHAAAWIADYYATRVADRLVFGKQEDAVQAVETASQAAASLLDELSARSGGRRVHDPATARLSDPAKHAGLWAHLVVRLDALRAELQSEPWSDDLAARAAELRNALSSAAGVTPATPPVPR